MADYDDWEMREQAAREQAERAAYEREQRAQEAERREAEAARREADNDRREREQQQREQREAEISRQEQLRAEQDARQEQLDRQERDRQERQERQDQLDRQEQARLANGGEREGGFLSTPTPESGPPIPAVSEEDPTRRSRSFLLSVGVPALYGVSMTGFAAELEARRRGLTLEQYLLTASIAQVVRGPEPSGTPKLTATRADSTPTPTAAEQSLSLEAPDLTPASRASLGPLPLRDAEPVKRRAFEQAYAHYTTSTGTAKQMAGHRIAEVAVRDQVYAQLVEDIDVTRSLKPALDHAQFLLERAKRLQKSNASTSGRSR